MMVFVPVHRFRAEVRQTATKYERQFTPHTALLKMSERYHHIKSVAQEKSDKWRKKISNLKYRFKRLTAQFRSKLKLHSSFGLSRHGSRVAASDASEATRYRNKAKFKSLLSSGSSHILEEDKVDAVASEVEPYADQLIQHKKIRPIVVQDYNEHLKEHDNDFLRCVKVYIKQVLNGQGRNTRKRHRIDTTFDKEVRINQFGYSYHARAQPVMLGDFKMAQPDADKTEQKVRDYLRSLHHRLAPVQYATIPGEEKHPKRKFVTRSSHHSVGATLWCLFSSKVAQGHVPFQKSTYTKKEFKTLSVLLQEGILKQCETERIQLDLNAKVAVRGDFVVNYAGTIYDPT